MKSRLLLCFICFAFFAQAQKNYSYITDRKFFDPTDLVGYNFRPGAVEIRDEYESELDPGEYSFGITQNNIYVEGGEIAGVYTVNNIETTDYGFKLLLMNARDATLQGHLKVIADEVGNVEAVVFRRSHKDPEMIFFQNEIPEDLNAEEEAFFTDRNELIIEDPDSIWGKSINPFLVIHHNGIQDRLLMSDSTIISFGRTLRFEDKHQKKKDKERKKMEKEAAEKLAKEQAEIQEEVVAEEKVDEEEISEKEMEEKVRKAKVLAFDISTLKTEKDLEELDEDILKDIVVKKEFFCSIRSILTYDDGTVEDKVWEHYLKGVTQREDAEAGPGEERYQLEVETKKGEKFYLYLTSDKAVSSFEFGDKLYLTRGH